KRNPLVNFRTIALFERQRFLASLYLPLQQNIVYLSVNTEVIEIQCFPLIQIGCIELLQTAQLIRRVDACPSETTSTTVARYHGAVKAVDCLYVCHVLHHQARNLGCLLV